MIVYYSYHPCRGVVDVVVDATAAAAALFLTCMHCLFVWQRCDGRFISINPVQFSSVADILYYTILYYTGPNR